MISSRSPHKVIRTAYRLACRVLPAYSSRFSCHSFTLRQLFACLVLREFYGLSYRRAEHLLRDSPLWFNGLGMTAAPDHNTLWRAMGFLIKTRQVNRMLDLQVDLARRARLLRLAGKPLATDSTCFEQRHRSGHYDRRCRQMRQASPPSPEERKRGKGKKKGKKKGTYLFFWKRGTSPFLTSREQIGDAVRIGTDRVIKVQHTR